MSGSKARHSTLEACVLSGTVYQYAFLVVELGRTFENNVPLFLGHTELPITPAGPLLRSGTACRADRGFPSAAPLRG